MACIDITKKDDPQQITSALTVMNHTIAACGFLSLVLLFPTDGSDEISVCGNYDPEEIDVAELLFTVAESIRSKKLISSQVFSGEIQ